MWRLVESCRDTREFIEIADVEPGLFESTQSDDSPRNVICMHENLWRTHMKRLHD
jgi:hypothetical protein